MTCSETLQRTWRLPFHNGFVGGKSSQADDRETEWSGTDGGADHLSDSVSPPPILATMVAGTAVPWDDRPADVNVGQVEEQFHVAAHQGGVDRANLGTRVTVAVLVTVRVSDHENARCRWSAVGWTRP
jgi:hypothetical protein